MTYQPGDEVQWQDPTIAVEQGDTAPWTSGTVVADPYPDTDLVCIHIGSGTVVALPAEYVLTITVLR